MYTGIVYIGWYLSFHFFQYLNYKSLESLLVTYPNATFYFKLIAPSAHQRDRYGELLPRPIIDKYARQGFNIFTIIQDRDDLFYRYSPAFRYWKDTFTKSFVHNISQFSFLDPSQKGPQTIIPAHALDIYPPPYHLLLYDVFLRLYRTGGLYSDLSWMHISSFPDFIDESMRTSTGTKGSRKNSKVRAGFAMRFSCHQVVLGPPNHPLSPTRPPIPWCRASSFFYFSKQHPVLTCLLYAYEQPHWQECFRKDTSEYLMAQGGFCIYDILQMCFRQTKSPNILSDESLTNLHQKNDSRKGENTTEKVSTVRNYIDSHFCFLEMRIINLVSDVQRLHIKENLIQRYQCRALLREHGDILLSYNSDKRFGNNIIDNSGDKREVLNGQYSVGVNQQALWMNLAGFYPEWLVPESRALLDRLISTNNNQLINCYRQFRHPNLDLSHFNVSQIQSKLHPYSVVNIGHESSYYFPLSHTGDSLASSKSVVIRGNRQRARMSSSLHFVIPGFMKAASTYLYDNIVSHPRVVPALRGFMYKEPGCYVMDEPLYFDRHDAGRSTSTFRQWNQSVVANSTANAPFPSREITKQHLLLLQYARRMSCYPFVETRQDLVSFGDASIIYAARGQSVLPRLLKDNPYVKILFAVRDPLERTLSSHRYHYRFLKSLDKQNINNCLEECFRSPMMHNWNRLALEAVDAWHKWHSQKATSSYLNQSDAALWWKKYEISRRTLSERFMLDMERVGKYSPAKVTKMKKPSDSNHTSSQQGTKSQSTNRNRNLPNANTVSMGRMYCFRLVYDSLYFPQLFSWVRLWQSLHSSFAVATPAVSQYIRVVNMHFFQVTDPRLTNDDKRAIMQQKKPSVIDSFDIESLFRSAIVGKSKNEISRLVKAQKYALTPKKKKKSMFPIFSKKKENLQQQLDQDYLKYQFNSVYR